MVIYTKFGDKGNTSLFGGKVVVKDDPMVEAYGAVDELNSSIGVIIAFSDDQELKEMLMDIQKDLFAMGAELASEGKTTKITPVKIEKLEKEIDVIEPQLQRLTNFVIPGGSKTAALLHLTRTICRRAERRIVTLSKHMKINPEIIKYLNRLSDLLFVLARFANRKKHFEETIWRGK